jgi:hypothetical protein
MGNRYRAGRIEAKGLTARAPPQGNVTGITDCNDL